MNPARPHAVPDSDRKGVVQVLEGENEAGFPNRCRLMMKSDDTQVDYWEGE
ncbi:MAG: hypothetical protein GWM87_02650 [Xanthomonadales bacterium]|nr:hypothetical protein [Xanthomonadales bacterium]NIX11954.1 hypothetical protein [Xanthomonadales bacterium]